MIRSTKGRDISADKSIMVQAQKILLIDDCQDTLELVRSALRTHTVEVAESLGRARVILAERRFDLLLIDVGLPDGSGFDLCAELMQDPALRDLPKIMLTARSEIAEKVRGFESGADDYVTKPFSPEELRARVESFFRRVRNEASLFCKDEFEFNLDFQRCTLCGIGGRRDLQLTPTEFRLFLTLAKHEGEVLTREELERALWHTAGVRIEKRGIDSHVAHLRKKLGVAGEKIISVYGKGYALKAA